MHSIRSFFVLGAVMLSAAGCWDGVKLDLARFLKPDDENLDMSDASVDASELDAYYPPYEWDSAARPDIELAVCGNSVVEANEECDDGNKLSVDGCSASCEIEEGYTCPTAGAACEACGNGEIEGTEECDDGNRDSGDGCDDSCDVEEGYSCLEPGNACEECGNGEVGMGEVCDDGNRESDDGCNSTCTFMEPLYACPEPGSPCEKCGDGAIDDHETCDDGNAVSGDGCNAFCTAVEDGFECDEAGEACTPICGDTFIAGDEGCDDGNTESQDGCDESCQLEEGWVCPIAGIRCIAAECNDGIVAGDEECEDGNDDPDDGCDENCMLEEGYVCEEVGEACRETLCNDGVKEGSEPCDDGNEVIGDGCNPFCEVEPSCTQEGCVSSCGDGMMLATDDEQCDDGNTLDGDGCSSDCKIEPGHACEVVETELPDTLEVPITYRDFIALPINGGVRHPDFEAYSGNNATPGLLENTLGADGKPVYTGICDEYQEEPTPTCPYEQQTTSQEDFDEWYRDTDGVNITSVERLPLNKQTDGSYYYPVTYLFPLDGAGWVVTQGGEPAKEDTHQACIFPSATANSCDDDGGDHNFGFTSELRYWFEFGGDESLNFSGDDDVWVFINRRLALDIGGLHPRANGSITINSSGIASWTQNGSNGQVDLGMSVGKIYEIVLFHAERHTNASNFNLTIKGFLKAKSACHTVCGDGIVTRDELCDDGDNNGEYGGCMSDCLRRGPYCGDGEVDSPEEQCDDGVRNGGYGGYDQCAPGCVLGPRCGDGHKDVGHEQCDDGNLDDDDGCSSDCRLERCGNGSVEAGEQCDDGNTRAGDGCSPRCDLEICGNGWLDPGEECDDGINDGGYGECQENCVMGPYCGDGHKDSQEDCDDGNNRDGDGCSSNCKADVIIG